MFSVKFCMNIKEIFVKSYILNLSSLYVTEFLFVPSYQRIHSRFYESENVRCLANLDHFTYCFPVHVCYKDSSEVTLALSTKVKKCESVYLDFSLSTHHVFFVYSYQHQNLDETQQETLKSNSQPRMKVCFCPVIERNDCSFMLQWLHVLCCNLFLVADKKPVQQRA